MNKVDKSYRRMPVPAVVEEDLAAEDRGVHGKDPALSHFLPLEEFDNAELADRDPEHFMCRDGGAVAKSKYYHDDGNYEWVPCRVLEYDEAENSFLIQWEHTQKLKWVKRFNLIFEGEVPSFHFFAFCPWDPQALVLCYQFQTSPIPAPERAPSGQKAVCISHTPVPL